MNTSLNIYDYVMRSLKTRRIPRRTVALGSGVPYSTVTKIAQGVIKEPSVFAVQKLADYFHDIDKREAA